MRKPSRGAVRAFTLIELLVVMAIAALALLLVSVGQAQRPVMDASLRQQCAGNLKQTAIALMSYTSDYNGYMPSNPALCNKEFDYCKRDAEGACTLPWNHDADREVNDFWRRPYRTGNSAVPLSMHLKYWSRPSDDSQGAGSTGLLALDGRTSGATEYSLYRCIGGGLKMRDEGSPADASRIWGEGALNAMPNGLGLLLSGQYVGDARVFYCAASEEMPSTVRRAGRDDINKCAGSEMDWAAAGGYDNDAMLRGDWRAGLQSPREHPNASQILLLSHYSYRNVPLSVTNAWHAELAGPNRTDPSQEIYLPGCRTRPYPDVGRPLFKSDRLLGLRAVVCDAFDKGIGLDAHDKPYAVEDGGDCTTPADTARHPGLGMFGHRTSYNVLYGDGAVRIFPDPEESIIWHESGYGDDGTDVSQWQDGLGGLNHYSSASFSGITRPDEEGKVGPGSQGAVLLETAERFRNSGNGIWHELDLFNGIDVPR